MNDDEFKTTINENLINSILRQVDELKHNNEKHIDIHDVLFNDLSTIRINVRNNLRLFDNDAKAIQGRFESIKLQNKIFHDNIKANKNKLDVLTRDRTKKSDFNTRVNGNIIDILTRIEKLEACEKKLPKETSILKRLEKLENKLNDITVKHKLLEKNSRFNKIQELEHKVSSTTEASNIRENKLIDFERTLFSFIL